MNKTTSITNKEVYDKAMYSTIKDLKGIQRQPSLGVNKRLRIGKGIRLFSSKSPICPTKEDGSKICEDCVMSCPFSLGKAFGCRDLKTYIHKRERDHIGRLEMYSMFWRRLRDEFKRLPVEAFHKTAESRERLWIIVKNADEFVYKLLKSKL